MVRSCAERQAAEHARGAAADQWQERDKRPYSFDGSLESGDEVLDHTEHGDGELVEYVIETTEEEWHGRTEHITTQTLGTHRVEGLIVRCECEATGDAFAIGTVPGRAAMTCPVCGADGSEDGLDSCTDARGSSGTSEDTDGRDDQQGGQGGQDVEPAQTTLSGFGGDD